MTRTMILMTHGSNLLVEAIDARWHGLSRRYESAEGGNEMTKAVTDAINEQVPLLCRQAGAVSQQWITPFPNCISQVITDEF